MASYYLVKGSNAVAVVQSWSQAKRIEKYFKSISFKGYDTYDEANAEFGLRSDKMKLLAGTYKVLTFTLYDKLEVNSNSKKASAEDDGDI